MNVLGFLILVFVVVPVVLGVAGSLLVGLIAVVTAPFQAYKAFEDRKRAEAEAWRRGTYNSEEKQ